METVVSPKRIFEYFYAFLFLRTDKGKKLSFRRNKSPIFIQTSELRVTIKDNQRPPLRNQGNDFSLWGLLMTKMKMLVALGAIGAASEQNYHRMRAEEAAGGAR